MSRTDSYPKMLIWLIIAMMVLAVMALLVVNWTNVSRSKIPVWGELPQFTFTAAHTGQPFGLEDMKGRLNVVDFIFTRCRSACPIMGGNFSELYSLYKGSDKVRFVSISVDPEHDSLAVLREYARQQGVTDDRWVFLRAPVEQVRQLCEGGFMLAADDLPGGHTTKFTLVDHLGRIRSYHEGLDSTGMRILKDNIRQLARDLP
ncbi:MAG: SCO family protein [candidate division Zixibacteria bacterium]|nr:SCO family protein [candidate division Zixibacteria bacterium]